MQAVFGKIKTGRAVLLRRLGALICNPRWRRAAMAYQIICKLENSHFWNWWTGQRFSNSNLRTITAAVDFGMVPPMERRRHWWRLKESIPWAAKAAGFLPEPVFWSLHDLL